MKFVYLLAFTFPMSFSLTKFASATEEKQVCLILSSDRKFCMTSSLIEETKKTKVAELEAKKKSFQPQCAAKKNGFCNLIAVMDYSLGNTEAALKQFSAICSGPESVACVNLGLHYEYVGDSTQSLSNFKTACSYGRAISKANFAPVENVGLTIGCYKLGMLNLTTDKEVALKDLKDSCEGGFDSACIDAGKIYYTDKNLNNATYFFDISCHNLSPMGCYNLATIYKEQKKFSDSAQRFKLACNGGFEEACSEATKMKKTYNIELERSKESRRKNRN